MYVSLELFKKKKENKIHVHLNSCTYRVKNYMQL